VGCRLVFCCCGSARGGSPASIALGAGPDRQKPSARFGGRHVGAGRIAEAALDRCVVPGLPVRGFRLPDEPRRASCAALRHSSLGWLAVLTEAVSTGCADNDRRRCFRRLGPVDEKALPMPAGKSSMMRSPIRIGLRRALSRSADPQRLLTGPFMVDWRFSASGLGGCCFARAPGAAMKSEASQPAAGDDAPIEACWQYRPAAECRPPNPRDGFLPIGPATEREYCRQRRRNGSRIHRQPHMRWMGPAPGYDWRRFRLLIPSQYLRAKIDVSGQMPVRRPCAMRAGGRERPGACFESLGSTPNRVDVKGDMAPAAKMVREVGRTWLAPAEYRIAI